MLCNLQTMYDAHNPVGLMKFHVTFVHVIWGSTFLSIIFSDAKFWSVKVSIVFLIYFITFRNVYYAVLKLIFYVFQLLSTSSKPDVPQNVSKIADFPGAKAPYVTEIKFLNETSYDPIPIYRVLDNNGEIIDSRHDPNIDKDTLLNMYKTMVQLTQMDKILYESQR